MSETSPSPAPATAGKYLKRVFFALNVCVALLVFTCGLGLFFLLGTEVGWRWSSQMLSRANIIVEGPTGRLWDSWGAAQVRYQTPELTVSATQMNVSWRLWETLQTGQLHIQRLSAQTLHTHSSAPEKNKSTSTLTPPADLHSPLGLVIDAFELDEWHNTLPDAEEGTPALLSHLKARLNGNAQAWTLAISQAQTPWGDFHGQTQLLAEPPFELSGQWQIQTKALEQTVVGQIDISGFLAAALIEAKLDHEQTHLEAQLKASPFASLAFESLHLQAQNIAPQNWLASAPKSLWHGELALEPVADANTQALTLKGSVNLENTQAGHLDQHGLPALKLQSDLEASAAYLKLSALNLQIQNGGQLTGHSTFKHAADQSWQVDSDLKLQKVNLAQWRPDLPQTALSGNINAAATAQQQNIKAQLADGRYALAVALTHEAGLLTLSDGKLSVNEPNKPGASAEFKGTFSTQDKQLALEAQSQNLDLSSLLKTAPRSSISLKAAVQADLNKQRVNTFNYNIAPGSQFANAPLSGEGSLSLDLDKLSAQAVMAHLLIAGNRLDAQGAWGRPGDQLKLKLQAPNLARLGLGVSGVLNVDANIEGEAQAPAGRFEFKADDLKMPSGWQLQHAKGQGNLALVPQAPFALNVELQGLNAPAPASPLNLSKANIQLAGTRSAHQLKLSLAQTQGNALQSVLSGALYEIPPAKTARKAPASSFPFRWQGQLEQLEITGKIPATLEAPAPLHLQADAFELSQARVRAGTQGYVHINALRWSSGHLQTQGQLSGLSLQTLYKDQKMPPPTLVLGGQWDVRLDQHLNGQLTLSRESGDWALPGDIPLALGLKELQAKLQIEQDALSLNWQAHGDVLGELSGQINTRAQAYDNSWRLDPNAALGGNAQFTLPNIQWMGRLTGSHNLRTQGKLQGQAQIAGTPVHPVVTGDINGEQLSFAWPDLGVVLAGGQFKAHLSEQSLKIEQLVFDANVRQRPYALGIPADKFPDRAGMLSLSGEVDLKGENGQLDLAADHFPLLQRKDRWLMASGQSNLKITQGNMDLNGIFGVDAAFIAIPERPAPSLDDDVVVLGKQATASESKRSITAEIIIGLGYSFYARGLGLDTRLEGEMRFKKDAAQALRATGYVASQGGVFKGYGQNLSIERGKVTFAGAVDNPWLDVLALRKGLEVEAGLAISGNVKRPVIRLASEPNVPDTEKLGWMILGRAPGQGGGAELGLLIPAAQALFGVDGQSMSTQLQYGLGLDELSLGQGSALYNRAATSSVLGQNEAASGQASQRILMLGKRLSNTASLTFEQSLSGAQSLVRLTIELSRTLSLISRAGTDNSIDLRYSFAFK